MKQIGVLTHPNYESSMKELCCKSFMHCHSYLEVLYILDDHVKVQINGQVFYANTGDIVFINSYDVHEVDGTKGQWVLLFDPSLIKQVSTEKSHHLLPHLMEYRWIKAKDFQNNKIEDIQTPFKAMIESLKSTHGKGSFVTTGQFYLFLDAIRSYTEALNETELDVVLYRDQKRIHEILIYLEEHYHEQTSLEDIAKKAGFTKHYFCRYFKKMMGKSFVDYLNEIRCQRARDLIENTEIPITTIALDTGFSSVSYFSRKFKSYWGESPRYYR